MSEKRSEERYVARVAVKVNTDDELEFASESRDISLSGICLYTDKPIAVKSKIMLNIELGQPPQLFKHLGEVMWCSEDSDKGRYRIGIQLHVSLGNSIAWKKSVLDVLTS